MTEKNPALVIVVGEIAVAPNVAFARAVMTRWTENTSGRSAEKRRMKPKSPAFLSIAD